LLLFEFFTFVVVKLEMLLNTLDLVDVPFSELIFDLLNVFEHVGSVWFENMHQFTPNVLLSVFREEFQKLLIN
jgi:hypothetical protein